MKEEEKEEVSHSSLSKDSCRDRKRFLLCSYDSTMRMVQYRMKSVCPLAGEGTSADVPN